MNEIKNCPFCGSSAITWEDEYESTKIYGVCCEECGITTACYDTEQQAIDDWNKRV